jgi:hypothetical protein
LTKILSVKAETGESQLSDRETSIEIGNLVFAGTGISYYSVEQPNGED